MREHLTGSGMSRLDALQVADDLARHTKTCTNRSCPCGQLQAGDVVCVYDTWIESTFPIPEGREVVVGVAVGRTKAKSWGSEIMAENGHGMFTTCHVDLVAIYG